VALRYETEGKIAYFTIDRPEKHNAIDQETMDELETRILEFDQDPSVWVAIITGAGEKAFCAGADLRKMVPKVTANAIPVLPTRRVYTFKGADVWKPVIAAVNGICLAAGTEILVGTDLRVAAEHATFGLPEVRWSLIARGGASVRLPRQIPWAIAMEMLMTGERISAQRAYEIGLVNRVVALEQLMPTAEELARKILANGPLAVRGVKESANRTSGLPLSYAYEVDFMVAAPVFASEDAKEGPRAYGEKRPPDYQAR
jgi:enoyl-CoA hydratase